MTDINNDEYYSDPKDNNMYLRCSLYIGHCLKCKYENGCKQCETGYIMLNDDFKTCLSNSTISSDKYFTEDGFMYYSWSYSCKKEKYKNNIKCFSEGPKLEINMTYLQAQIVNYILYIFIMTHSPLPKPFSFKLLVKIYNSKNLRYLEEKQIIVTSNYDSNSSKNKIITFTSGNLKDELNIADDDNIQIVDIGFNDNDPTTKIVIDNNECSLNYDKDSDLIDTGKVKSLILANKIPNCKSLTQNDLISLTMDKIEDVILI